MYESNAVWILTPLHPGIRIPNYRAYDNNVIDTETNVVPSMMIKNNNKNKCVHTTLVTH